MNNPFDFFDKIFCINLDARTDRWAEAQNEFKNVGILDKVERWSAGPRLPASNPQANIATRQNPHQELGCIARARDDLDIIKLCKRKRYKNVLIFEDDVKFIDYNEESVQRCINKISRDSSWDMFFLGGRPKTYRYYNRTARINKRRNTHTVIRPKEVLWTVGYCINESIYDNILNHLPTRADWKYGTLAIDQYYVEMTKKRNGRKAAYIKALCICPIIVTQSGSPSTLRGGRDGKWKGPV